MPGKVKVRILSARDLPVMDRASELTDAFVEVKFGTEIYKTEVCKKSLNPQWNSEWFKFEVDDEELQDEPLDLRVLDYDTYSAHDTIGKVYIDLNPLLSRENSNIISGWFPIYDTMQGLRGELNIQVRVELFSDFNKFRQSSCGIQFFCTCAVPSGWRVQNILGFIEELVVNDDPEYHWIEKIRTPRASNETVYYQCKQCVSVFQEYPFFTLRSFPVGFICSFGGVVSARSVKLLDKIHNPEEPETRDAWWSEVRTEVKSHAAKLGCHAVLGYMEQTTICDEVIVLSAVGTAAKINLNFDCTQLPAVASAAGLQASATPTSATAVSDKDAHGGTEKERDKDKYLFVDTGLANQGQLKSTMSVEGKDDSQSRCSLCHIPYNPSSMPFEIQLSKCAICKKKNVPEVLFATVDPPENMLVCSKGCLIQARICRAKNKNKSSEQSAREISDSLPFIEYEIHNQLINKLKIRGLNCLFGLRIQICLGENMLIAVATATGAYLGPLPAPPQPKITTEVATAQESRDLITLQKKITLAVQVYRERLGSEFCEPQPENNSQSTQADEETDEEEEDGSIFLEATKDKNTFVLVIDDLKDDAVSLILQDVLPPEGYEICNTQTPTGIAPDRITANLQMFTQMVRVRYQPTSTSNLDFSDVFNTILRRLFFKLRHLRPCCLTDMCFNVDLPDEDEIV
ncbi:unnamed protein product, partial [Candidula unifasciata]